VVYVDVAGNFVSFLALAAGYIKASVLKMSDAPQPSPFYILYFFSGHDERRLRGNY
jgi:hypothetical protein